MIGDMLKEWRQARGYSQLALALDANISARHLSFLETGRSRPSPDMVLRLSAALNMPLRERNTMLVAAGFAPCYGDSGIDADELAAIRKAVALILKSHSPYPAVALNAAYEIVDANDGFRTLFALAGLSHSGDAARLTDLVFDDGPNRNLIENWTETVVQLVVRMRNEIRLHGPASPLAPVLQSALSRPGVKDALEGHHGVQPAPFIPLILNLGGQRSSWISTMTTFGAPQDAFVEELTIEQFHPADEATEQLVRQLAAS